LAPGLDCKEGGPKSPSWRAFVRAAVWGCALSCSRTTPLMSIPRSWFWIDLRRLFSVSQ
jgi:hypothetical protein